MSPEPMPRSFSMSVLSPSRASASRPVSPSETPLKNRPMLQPMITPRWRRTASPSGWRSTGLAPGRPGPLGEDPGALVAARAQRDRAGDEHGAGGDHQRQRPPLLARVRAHVLAPADRRQPRQRAVADVARGAQQVGGAERRAGDPVHRRAGLADLRRDRGDAGEHEPDAGQRGAERERALRRLVDRDHRERDEQPEQQLHGGHHAERHRDRREAPDRGRADQLAAAGLLLLRACGGRRRTCSSARRSRRRSRPSATPCRRRRSAGCRAGPTIAIRPGLPLTVAS